MKSDLLKLEYFLDFVKELRHKKSDNNRKKVVIYFKGRECSLFLSLYQSYVIEPEMIDFLLKLGAPPRIDSEALVATIKKELALTEQQFYSLCLENSYFGIISCLLKIQKNREIAKYPVYTYTDRKNFIQEVRFLTIKEFLTESRPHWDGPWVYSSPDWNRVELMQAPLTPDAKISTPAAIDQPSQ